MCCRLLFVYYLLFTFYREPLAFSLFKCNGIIIRFINSKVSNEVKQTIECELDIPYGSREAEKFDIFGAQILPSGWDILKRLASIDRLST